MNSLIKYKTLIVDDEVPARQRLTTILSEFEEIELVGEASNGIEALELIQQLKPDLLFLDIQMPGLDGFEVLKNTDHFPVVIFCTAYDDYALQAFETSAIDYIVKPVKPDRVQKSIEKIKNLKTEVEKEKIIEVIGQYMNQKKTQKLTNIPVKVGDRMLFVKLSDISYFHAEEKYVTIVDRVGKTYLTDHSLKYLEEKLSDSFIRVHRAFLINRNLIQEVGKHLGGKSFIRMDDSNSTKIITGRYYQENIKKITCF